MLSYTTTDNTSPAAIIANTAYTTGRAVSPVVAPSPDSVDGAVAASPVLPSALPLLELSGVVGCVGTVGTVGVSPLLLSSLPDATVLGLTDLASALVTSSLAPELAGAVSFNSRRPCILIVPSSFLVGRTEVSTFTNQSLVASTPKLL